MTPVNDTSVHESSFSLFLPGLGGLNIPHSTGVKVDVNPNF